MSMVYKEGGQTNSGRWGEYNKVLYREAPPRGRKCKDFEALAVTCICYRYFERVIQTHSS